MLSFFNKIFRSTDDQQQKHNESTTNKMNLNHLSSMARNVTQNHGTEPPFSSPLNSNKQRGVYACVVCNTPIFSSEHKFDSGTGWPSFYQPYIAANLGTKTDYALIYPRTEVHCAKCNAHFGHVFNDGPQPTGLRYCINGVAMNFIPQ